jgi:hypothetical protein
LKELNYHGADQDYTDSDHSDSSMSSPLSENIISVVKSQSSSTKKQLLSSKEDVLSNQTVWKQFHLLYLMNKLSMTAQPSIESVEALASFGSQADIRTVLFRDAATVVTQYEPVVYNHIFCRDLVTAQLLSWHAEKRMNDKLESIIYEPYVACDIPEEVRIAQARDNVVMNLLVCVCFIS